MDDMSSPNSSNLSVFDSGAGTDVGLHDDDTSPFSSTNDKGTATGFANRESSIRSSMSSTASSRPIMLLPATERSGSISNSSANGSLSQATAESANGTAQQRKRRSKKTAGEKKDATASAASDGKEGTVTNAAGKVIKRRAARACVSCRNRKVRCDVVETFPCGNCRWDKIECVVQEGRRRRRGLFNAREAASAGALPGAGGSFGSQDLRGHSHNQSHGIANGANGNGANHAFDNGFGMVGSDATKVAAALNQGNGARGSFDFSGQQRISSNPLLLPKGPIPQTASVDPTAAPIGLPGFPLLPINGVLGDPQQQIAALLPGFIRPLPGKMAPEDIVYLHSKGAFTLPDITLQKALLHAYVEFVHPYMPLLELHPLLETIHERDGKSGTVSLLLYHAIMFTAASFVPAKFLKAAGFSRRREARKSFFMKARALYDFDYETDRLTLVQALLLMTYWYETPDDQKDTWHWMGVAVSLAHTIGLHRDPRTTGEPIRRQRLRKLLWWCCFMRDRMIALGMRRPKRIRSEDADVPMLTPTDFETAILPEDIDVVPTECRLVRDVEMQEQLAELCVEKAKLCVLVGNMLQQQYTILPRGRQRGSDAGSSNSTMMLFPNRPVSDDGKGNGPSVVDKIDAKLRAWLLALPVSCRYAALTPADVQNGRATVAVQRTLLHLVYHTTMSALHRPRIQPVAAGAPMLPIELQEFSRARVRDAADCVTRMGGEMLRLRLEPYLPTAGVTVFLPAMFAHLLDIKGGVPRERRQQAVLGFLTCMRIMESLRETYAAAEIAKGFVESLLKKAGINLAAVANFNDDNAAGGMSIEGEGTGTSTPINGASASLLNATSNVGVPYTEDGIAHAVAMYAANTPKAMSARTTPPADNEMGGHVGSTSGSDSVSYSSSTSSNGVNNSSQNKRDSTQNGNTINHGSQGSNGQNGNLMQGLQNHSNNTVPYMPTSVAAAAARLMEQGLQQAASDPMPMSNGNGIATVNTAVEQMWGLTPSGSAVSEDPFEWDAMTADPAAMKLDFDQWLDFPPEGMGSSTDHAFVGLFNSDFGNDLMNTDF
ncbi:ct1b fusso cutinase transcription factor 1 beta [Sporothrix brasiliensis 5110]|uniref:Ct1b fusso cutinase transcription factor 1 beta n=1 Tax=Sporothrix brasiliensis 5110 TaxID=1398154 RepID=A0A0C2ES57_9PEZI|nr:ct1b fusso cutinase transcription factor 1 beta [Sporothrix brasiliensis 5110]KIH89159.1 ct1b fusso cutinase transcription factor 1 beta [Sporothrix brasiliensis 5110]